MPSKLSRFFFPSAKYTERVSEEVKSSVRRRTEETSKRLQSIEAEIKLENLRREGR